jgi:hypothetical protein
MDLLMVLFLAFAMCMMLASIVAGGYVLLSRPQATESQPLLSAEDLDALSGKLDEAGNAVQYSNVLDARIGFDSKNIIKSATLEPADCQAFCDGSANCGGFQISGQNSCDLLANVTATYAFVEPGYNVFVTPPVNVPPDAFDTGHQGEISGRDVTRAPSASPAPREVFTKHECARICHDTPGCKSFSVSPTLGCRPKSALNLGEASVYASGDWNSYFKKDVKHSTGWSWKTPAPSPRPT